MELNDGKIKNWILFYNKACIEHSEHSKCTAIEGFKKEIEIYSYNFPRLAYKKGLDICSDFYLFVMDRLESIIKNYPVNEELKFKTWFNYVLKNQFLNFMIYQKKNKVQELQIENFENELFLEVFEHDEMEMAELKEGLKNLDAVDRIMIKFFYMPELLDSSEIQAASNCFHLPVSDILEIQNKLIAANMKAINQIRELSSRIRKINKVLMELKCRLCRKKELEFNLEMKEKNEILLKIARNDASKNKYLRRLEIPNKAVFLEFMRLFKNIYQAKNRLSIAKKKLKFEILKLLKTKNGWI